MKRILAITFLEHFVSGGLALIIPLVLLERNVSLAEISVILSILPLVFLLMRLFLAAIADQVGWARFYLLLHWPGALVSTVIYAVASSNPVFLFGKIIEAVKVSSYWAVNRTAIFSLSPKQKAAGATRNVAVQLLAIAIGSAISGIALSLIGFALTLSMLIFASAIIVIPAGLLWRVQRKRTNSRALEAITLLNPRGKSKTFWVASIAMLFSSLAFYPLLTLLLPVFMTQRLGYDYATIGVAFMLYNLLTAAATFSSLKMPINIWRVVVQSAIALFVTFLLSNSGNYFLALFLALALADGFAKGFYESIIAKVTKNELAVSIDIGLLNVPMRIAEFTSILSTGFVAQAFGYLPIFAASGVFFTVFSALALYVLEK
jgi:MFS family permease